MSHPPRTERETEIAQLVRRFETDTYTVADEFRTSDTVKVVRDLTFLLSQLDAVRADLQALIEGKVYRDSDVGDNGVSDTQYESVWWAIEGEGHSRVFATADEALAAYRAAMSEPSVAGSVSPEQKGEK